MQHEKFQIYTLKINTIIWHRKKNSDYFWTRVYSYNLKHDELLLLDTYKQNALTPYLGLRA